LNNVHFRSIRIEHCSFNPEDLEMQTLAAEIAVTFVDDAIALVTGAGRIAIRFVMSPVERLATACDVAGVLAARRRLRPMRPPAINSGAGSRRGAWQLVTSLFSLHRLNHLT
jgi:hypothetical protein